MDGGQAQFSARVMERDSSPAKKRSKPNLLGGEHCGVRKAHVGGFSADKVFLLRLTQEHKRLLRHAHAWAHSHLSKQGRLFSTVQLRDTIVGCFNEWHVQSISAGRVGGYGGHIKPSLVMEFLNEVGKSGLQQQLAHRVQHPPAQSQQRGLADEQIDQLNRTRARDWCRHFSLRVGGTVEELRARLKEHLKKVAH